MTGWWKDTGQLDDMLEANRLVLEDIERRIDGELVDSKVEGRVVVEAGARLERAVVRGPAIIGADARITDAYIGPYTSIDAGVSVVARRGRALDPARRVERLGPRLAHGGEPAGPQRQALARRRASQDPADDRRRQLGDQDPVRVLVTGAAGMLGRDVTAACHARDHEVVALAHAALDITDRAAVEEAMTRYEPDAVVNCAAFTDVDGAEDDEAGAMRVNDEGAALLAAAAASIGAKVALSVERLRLRRLRARALRRVRPSLAAVGLRPLQAGGGDLGRGRQPAPLHRPLRPGCSGLRGKNFVETMLRLGAEQSEVLVVSDQVGCPTYTRHLGEAIALLVEGEEFGIHHLAGGGQCSWYEFAQEIFDQAGVECRVMAATTEMLARKAPRPAYSVLGSERPDAIALPALEEGPGRLPRRRERSRRPREAPGRRRRRLHRLGLRAPPPRRSPGRLRPRARQAHLRGPAREPRRSRRGPRRAGRGRHRRPRRRRRRDRGLRRDRQLRRRVPRRPLDRLAGRVHPDRRLRRLRPARGRARGRHPPPPGLDRRGLRLDRVRLLHRGLAASSPPRRTRPRRPAAT